MRTCGPKALVELPDGPTVIERQLRMVGEAVPGADIVVVDGFEAERLCRKLPSHVRIVENEDYEKTNTARSVAMGMRAVPKARSVLVVYGDLVFNEDALKHFQLGRSAVLVDMDPGRRPYEVGVTVAGRDVVQFSYGLPLKWGHVAMLSGGELAAFKKIALHKDRRRYFSFEIFNDILEQGGKLAAVMTEGLRLVEIDTMADIDEARRLASPERAL